MKPMNFRKASRVARAFGVMLNIITLIAFAGYRLFVSIPQASAAVTATPSITVGNSTNSAWIGISGPGPYTQDFQFVLCWQPAPNWNNPWQTTCLTSPWASESVGNGIGKYSNWIWPGHSDEMGGGSHLYISSVNTRALPAGQQLDDVVLGIELSENNNGSLATTNGGYNNLSCDNNITSRTPYSTEYSGAKGYVNGCNTQSPTDTPDVLRVMVGADIRSATMSSSNIPDTMTPGQTIFNATINVTNSSTSNTYLNTDDLSFKATSWNAVATSPGTGGYCEISDGLVVDNNGSNVLDSPRAHDEVEDEEPHDFTCSTPVNAVAKDMGLAHTGSFTTAQTVPYVPANNAYYADYRSGWVVYAQCTDDDRAIHPQMCQDTYWPAYFSAGFGYYGILRGQSYSFNIGNFTAPTTPGTYTETWTLSDSQGAVPGGTYSKTITVVGTNGTINVNADISAASWCAYSTPHQWQGSGTSGNDPSAVASQSGTAYSLEDHACDRDTHPYGFSVASHATYRNPPSILARVIKTAEASTCTDWICALTNGGTISYTLTSEYCKIYVNASINDPVSIGLAGVNFTVSNQAPYINSYSGTTGTITTSSQLLTDKNDPNATPPSYPQTFDFQAGSLSPTITVSGNIADFSGYTITRASDGLVMSSNRNNFSIPTACAVNDSLTFNATYKTRAVLGVH